MLIMYTTPPTTHLPPPHTIKKWKSFCLRIDLIITCIIHVLFTRWTISSPIRSYRYYVYWTLKSEIESFPLQMARTQYVSYAINMNYYRTVELMYSHQGIVPRSCMEWKLHYVVIILSPGSRNYSIAFLNVKKIFLRNICLFWLIREYEIACSKSKMVLHSDVHWASIAARQSVKRYIDKGFLSIKIVYVFDVLITTQNLVKTRSTGRLYPLLITKGINYSNYIWKKCNLTVNKIKLRNPIINRCFWGFISIKN